MNTETSFKLMRRLSAIGSGILLLLLSCNSFSTENKSNVVKKVKIERRELMFDGASFGNAGQFEKIIGTATVEFDLDDRHNAVIVDKDLVSLNHRRKAEFDTDFYIIQPKDKSRSNGKMLFEFNNRGNKRIFTYFNDSASSLSALNDPDTLADAGNAFVLEQGYTMAWAGWQLDVLPGANRLTVRSPPLTPRAEATTGMVAVQFDAITGTTARLAAPAFDPYRPVSLTDAQAVLTERESIDGQEVQIPRDQWTFAQCDRAEGHAFTQATPSPTHICLPAGFKRDRLYTLKYRAKAPRPMGFGYALTRDIVAFLRSGERTAMGDENPLSDRPIRNVICVGISSSGMFARDWLYLGFNEDTRGGKVCDGMMIHIPGAHRLFANTRFAQPDLYSRQDLWAGLYPLSVFPFSYGITTDPVTERTDGILKRPATDPLVFQTDTSLEYWQMHASLVTHDANGRPLDLPKTMRYYQIASTQHLAIPGAPPAKGMCEQLTNPSTAGVFLRPLLLSMEKWVSDGVEPPPSVYPRQDQGTLVSPARRDTGFPDIPGVRYPGLVNALPLRNYGPGFTASGGIVTNVPPPSIPGKRYAVLVPKADEDGNDIAGLRRPDTIGAPLATYTGWNVRQDGYRRNDLCGVFGSFIPFAKTKEERKANGDPRLSLEERYPDQSDYAHQLAQAAEALLNRKLLLRDDVDKMTSKAKSENLR